MIELDFKYRSRILAVSTFVHSAILVNLITFSEVYVTKVVIFEWRGQGRPEN
jgi:hypothetical protein